MAGLKLDGEAVKRLVALTLKDGFDGIGAKELLEDQACVGCVDGTGDRGLCPPLVQTPFGVQVIELF